MLSSTVSVKLLIHHYQPYSADLFCVGLRCTEDQSWLVVFINILNDVANITSG